LEVTPDFNTMISGGAFAPKEKFHGETFLFFYQKWQFNPLSTESFHHS